MISLYRRMVYSLAERLMHFLEEQTNTERLEWYIEKSRLRLKQRIAGRTSSLRFVRDGEVLTQMFALFRSRLLNCLANMHEAANTQTPAKGRANSSISLSRYTI